jgi:hypothetical protein
MGAPTMLGNAAWDYLFHYRHVSHFSPNFNESVTNWVGWFDAENPDLKLSLVNGKPVSLTLRDPKGHLFTIPFAQMQP